MLLQFCSSSVGKKYLMGVTGLVWAGFVFGHMAGNMLIFVSPQAYNSYGHALTSGMSIYLIEGLLLFALLSHVFLAINLTLNNRKSRPIGYAQSAPKEKSSTLASRTMAVQGSLILAFIVTHLATFKFGTVYETTVDGVVMRDLHRLMLDVFSQPGYVAWYVVALVFLGFHLRHGVSSIFQSFGLLHPSYQKGIKLLGIGYAVVVGGGFIAQPLYVFLSIK